MKNSKTHREGLSSSTKSSRKPCVVGNWKMQGSKKFLSEFLSKLEKGLDSSTAKKIEVVLCPPNVYLSEAFHQLAGEKRSKDNANTQEIKLGAQNVYCESQGAFTGEVAPEMLKDCGCQYVIIGHSERRQLFFEDDALIARKFLAAYHSGLTPILCVGETASERAEGQTLVIIRRQLAAVFAEFLDSDRLASLWSTAVIAYEPVWAIGTGDTASPEQAEEVHLAIRRWLLEQGIKEAEKFRILYGGSVKADNAKGLFAMPNINGALVGGASLKAEEFLSICKSASVNNSESI